MMPYNYGWNSHIEVGMQLEYTISTGRDPGSFQAYDVRLSIEKILSMNRITF